MNRLIVALAAASVLGTGCSSDTCDSRTVAIGWPSYLLFDGTHTSSCSLAPYVDVYMDGHGAADKVGTFNCADLGVNVIQVPNGSSHRFTVEGLNSSGTILFRDEVTVGSSNCTNLIVDTYPAEGTFQLAYTFTPSNVCTAGGVIWFEITDQVSGDLIAVDDTSTNAAAYACSADDVTFLLPAGDYTVDKAEEAYLSGSSYFAAHANCTGTTFAINGGETSSVPLAMAATGNFCP